MDETSRFARGLRPPARDYRSRTARGRGGPGLRAHDPLREPLGGCLVREWGVTRLPSLNPQLNLLLRRLTCLSMANASQEQKVLLELFQKFHVQAGLSITEIREITAKVFVELEVRQRPERHHSAVERRAPTASDQPPCVKSSSQRRQL